jgi:hypothetical protein
VVDEVDDVGLVRTGRVVRGDDLGADGVDVLRLLGGKEFPLAGFALRDLLLHVRVRERNVGEDGAHQ